MLNADQLERAVSQGIISREQVEALQNLALTEQAMAGQPSSGDAALSGEMDFGVSTRDEPFRLLKGFRDFFIAIGIVILSIGLSTLVGAGPFVFAIADNSSGVALAGTDWKSVASLLVLVAIAVAISEWVTKSQRLPLSSLVLTLVFALWSGLLASALFYVVATAVGFDGDGVLVPYAGIAGAILALVWHYKRYRLPFVLLPLAGVAVAGVLMFASGFFDLQENSTALRLVLGLSGVGVFIFAMIFDMQDRYRTTRLSECAFWLHLLAAPMIVHSLLRSSDEGGLSSITILLVVAIFTIFALIIDRRAMLVSALVYLGYSVLSILQDLSFLGESNNAATYVILGALVLGLGLGWAPIRRFFVNNLLSASWREKLPPVAA